MMRLLFFSLCLLSALTHAQTVVVKAEFSLLSGIEKAIAQGEMQDALQRIDAIKKQRVSAQTFALSRQLAANIYVADNAYDKALAALQLAAKQPKLSSDLRRSLTLNQARMHYALEDWEAVVQLLGAFKVGKLKAQYRVLLGDSLLKQQRYREAAKALSVLKGASASEAQLQLLLLARQKAEQSQQVVTLLQQMLVRFPLRERYWLQLARHYQSLGNGRQSSAVLHTAYLQGVLNSKAAIKRLAQLLLQQGAPMKSAQVVADAMARGLLADSSDNWLLLARAQISAKDFTVAKSSLQRALALEQSLTARRLMAAVLLQLREWEAAQRQLKALIAQAPAQLNERSVLGYLIQAHYHLNQHTQAQGYLTQAISAFPDDSQLSAWQRLLENG